MNLEVELRRLPMADKSVVVLTNLRVYHHKDKGIFGEEKTSIRHEAITSVQIGWKRSEGLLLSGIILLGICLFLWIGANTTGPAEIASDQQALDLSSEESLIPEQVLQYIGGFFSSSFISIFKYASLMAGVGMLVLFWFYKLSEVQIVGPGATIKGNPKNYEDGCKFCDFLLALPEGHPTAAPKEESAEKTGKEEKPPPEEKPRDKEWRL